MQIVLMTQPNNQGISDVFTVFTLPEGSSPEVQIARWSNIANNSPVKTLVVTNKENLTLSSIWNPNTELFSLSDGHNPELIKPLYAKTIVFLVNNVVEGMLEFPKLSSISEALEVAYSEPVIVKAVEESINVKMGDTWDGTNFISSN